MSILPVWHLQGSHWRDSIDVVGYQSPRTGHADWRLLYLVLFVFFLVLFELSIFVLRILLGFSAQKVIDHIVIIRVFIGQVFIRFKLHWLANILFLMASSCIIVIELIAVLFHSGHLGNSRLAYSGLVIIILKHSLINFKLARIKWCILSQLIRGLLGFTHLVWVSVNMRSTFKVLWLSL